MDFTNFLKESLAHPFFSAPVPRRRRHAPLLQARGARDRGAAALVHTHSDAPRLDSPWCNICSALLDWAIVAAEGEVGP
jgi:hypothetical protein